MRLRPVSLGVVAALAVALVACVPEPGPEPSVTATTPPATTTPSATTPTATEEPAALPGSCEALYSPAMLAMLQNEQPPLNDPGLTLLSTENVQGLDLLNSGVPTLRCTWGVPSESGLATTVARVDTEATGGLQQSLAETGFACEPFAGGSLCSLSSETLDQDDVVRTSGEVHWFGDGFWSATRWVDYDPEGYTEDVATTLTG